MIQKHLVKVGMADLNVTKDDGLLRTTGLGSCVGLTLYDPVAKIAGMAHVMLPTSEIAKDPDFNKAKYADSALPELLIRMEHLGATAARLIAKLAGGAQMFSFGHESDLMRIGPRNVEACKYELALRSIPVAGEDTGGNYGRTIELDSSTGILYIRSVHHGTKEL